MDMTAIEVEAFGTIPTEMIGEERVSEPHSDYLEATHTPRVNSEMS